MPAILLDTDIGSDVDDALCLAYLLARPDVDLLGVTTVSGRDPRERASLADAVCRAAGRTDVPVHAGSSTAVDSARVVQPDVPQAAVLDRFGHRPPGDFASDTAVEHLRGVIGSRPGEVTLLAIGPLTNVARLFAGHPHTAGQLGALVMMAGRFFGPDAEWNARCDPAATDLVYRTPVARHVSYGLDVTRQVTMPAADVAARLRAAGGAAAVAAACTGVWAGGRDTVTFHDPLAGACAVDPSLCTLRPGTVTVDRDGAGPPGRTRFSPGADGPHRVADTVDAGRFLAHYFATLSA